MTATIVRPGKPLERITKADARRVVAIVDQGLCSGMGEPIPGQMCVEAAICYALGMEHGDEPKCVEPCIRAYKIAINDAAWSDDMARARGMRRAAVAQLGSAGVVDPVKWSRIVALETVRQIVPRALRFAIQLHQDEAHKVAMETAALKCEQVGEDLDAARYAASAARYAARAASAASAASDAARAASDAASAASDAARYAASEQDAILSTAAEICVQACVKCGSPGAKWLDLTPLE